MADTPRDVIVVSSECWEIDRGTLDNIRMWGVNIRSESKVCVVGHPTELNLTSGVCL